MISLANKCINTDVFRRSVRFALYTLKNAGYAGVGTNDKQKRLKTNDENHTTTRRGVWASR